LLLSLQKEFFFSSFFSSFKLFEGHFWARLFGREKVLMIMYRKEPKDEYFKILFAEKHYSKDNQERTTFQIFSFYFWKLIADW